MSFHWMALTRKVSPQISKCELTHMKREPISFEKAAEQHGQYCQALQKMGLEVKTLPSIEDLPDSVFVEDPAVVVDEVAVISRMGVKSREPENEAMAEALKPYRDLKFIQPPG